MIKNHRSTVIELRQVPDLVHFATFPLTNAKFQANIKLESYGYAIADASKAIELDESYVKVSLYAELPNLGCVIMK